MSRWRAMAGTAVAMMFHDRAKLGAGLVGVLFATVLIGQQAGTFMSLLAKNTMIVDHAGADVWIAPLGTTQVQPNDKLPERVLAQARAVPGVAWASPLYMTLGTFTLPGGGSEAVTILGVEPTTLRGGPWNVIAGDPADLAQPDAIFIEDSQREQLGQVNLGSVREVNGRRVHVVGLTWGLLPFGPSLAFTSIDKARELARDPERRQDFVLVKVAEGEDPAQVAARLRERVSGVAVFTRGELGTKVVRWVLTRTPIGVTLGTSTLFALIVGFVVVAIAMFGSVVDNAREFGTLKAIGARMGDLTRLLLVQAGIYAAIGSGIGMFLVGLIVRAVRSPKLDLALPAWLIVAVPLLMLLVCVAASLLALMRLRKLEPAIVFRG